jgi:hypothetical protein
MTRADRRVLRRLNHLLRRLEMGRVQRRLLYVGLAMAVLATGAAFEAHRDYASRAHSWDKPPMTQTDISMSEGGR